MARKTPFLLGPFLALAAVSLYVSSQHLWLSSGAGSSAQPRAAGRQRDDLVGRLLAEDVLQQPPEGRCSEVEEGGSIAQAGRQPCGRQVLLLGFHNTRTSFSSRLIILMGAWAGTRRELDIGKHNPLKWWSRRDVLLMHDELLKKYTAESGLPSWLAVGFDAAKVSAEDKAQFQAKAGQVVAKLNKHGGPWVMKDNRFGYTGALWLELMEAAVCVVTYRHPALTALRLSQHPMKGKAYGLSARWYLGHWEDYMLRTLRLCAGRPTVLLPTDLAQPRALGTFYALLDAQLRAAGASGVLRVPTAEALHKGFLQHWREEDNRTKRSAALVSNATEEEAAAQAGCKRSLAVEDSTAQGGGAAAGTAEAVVAAAAAAAGGRPLHPALQLPPLWPEGCALEPSKTTLGLVRAFDLATHALLTTGKVLRPTALAEELLRLALDDGAGLPLNIGGGVGARAGGGAAADT